MDGQLPKREREALLDPIVVDSAKEAEKQGHSLALIRPRNTRFFAKLKPQSEIDEEREAFRKAASQTSMFDKELAELEPSPYDFRFKFEDAAGKHNYRNGDWEAHAMFWRECKRTGSEKALEWMNHTFNEEYPKRGMAFAIGNLAKRRQTWQLLGVIRLDEVQQTALLL